MSLYCALTCSFLSLSMFPNGRTVNQDSFNVIPELESLKLSLETPGGGGGG